MVSRSDTLSLQEILILAILEDEPSHPYRINEILEEKGLRKYISLAFSSVYSIVDKLHKKGYLTNEVELQEKAPPRNLYFITEEGRKALTGAIRKNISSLHFPPFEILLYNYKLFSRKELTSILEGYLDNLNGRIRDKFSEISRFPGDISPEVRSLAERELYLLQAEKRWVTGFIQIL